MKISFRGTATNQEAVTHTQEEMREYRRVKTPVFKRLLIFLTILALLFGLWSFYKRHALYAYGIVSGRVAPVTAGFATEIRTVLVSKGDVVKKGDVLFTQASVEGEALLGAARAALYGKRAQYDLMDNFMASGPGERSSPDFGAALESQRELWGLKQQGETLARERLRAEARYEMVRLKTLYEARRTRHENLQTLHRLDAAPLSQVTAADTEKKLRYNEYLRARDHYNGVVQANRIATAEAEKEGRHRESTWRREAIRHETEFQALISELETATAHLARLQHRYGATAYRAPFDAIITEIHVAPGFKMAAGDAILTSTSLDNLWVDVYVAAEKAPLFTREREILIYGSGGHSPISGTLTTDGGVELGLPSRLREVMPNVSSAVYFHVGYENGGTMLPGNIVKVVVK